MSQGVQEHSGNFTSEFINGILAACMMKYHDQESIQMFVTIVPEPDDWDAYSNYTLGPTNTYKSLLDVYTQADLSEYVDANIDDEPHRDPLLYLAELQHTTVEIGGWERINTETDILTFDDLEFIRGVKDCLEWLNRPTSLTVINTETFVIVNTDQLSDNPVN